jgi:dTDP-4-amino-4,6-dideoxygalactose transaminase/nucleoside-diphosphate-sugar epimerase
MINGSQEWFKWVCSFSLMIIAILLLNSLLWSTLMRIVITGGAGYLGSWVTALLLEKGHQVRIFDRFCFGSESLQEFSSSDQLEIVEGDIRRLQEFPTLLDGVDGVVHLAGLANDPSCDLDPELTLDVNVDSTIELVNMAVQKGVRRFAFASSCSVYGHGLTDLLDEESPMNPVSAYAESKILGEEAILGLKSDTFEPVAGRMATLFGWSRRMRFDLAVNQMTATAVTQNVVKVMGGGKQWRPFIHVKDAARAFVMMLEAPAEKISGEAFNVGVDDQNVQIRGLAEQVAKIVPDTSLEVQSEDDDRRTYRVVFDKIKDVLGFSQTVSIEDAVKEIEKDIQEKGYDPFDENYFNVRRMQSLMETPVEDGGEPVAPRFIALAKPIMDEGEEQVVLDAMRSGWVTSGPHIGAFETAFGEAVQSDHVVATASCTNAIHLCLAHLGVGPGEEVIIPPITWGSIGNMIVHMGATPVFADINGRTLNVDPASIEEKITKNTRAIIPVHMAGQACDLEAIYALSEKHGIPIIEDAAHAFGTTYNGKPIGSIGDLSCFSFYAIKNITTLEGGAIACKDAETAAHLKMLAANGMSANAWQRYGRSAVPSPPEVVEPGFKYAMGNVAAAIGLEQLKKWPEFASRRKRLAHLYQHVLNDIDELELLDVQDHDAHAWHLMIIRLRLDKLSKTRDEIAFALRQENVGSGYHFWGLHLHPYFRDRFNLSPEDLPESTAASHEVLSLPLHPGLTEKNVQDVASALKKVLAHSRS